MRRCAFPIVVVLAACGDDAGVRDDAAPDMPPDAADMCGATAVYLTGEYVDWDSTEVDFLGIFDATLAVVGDAGRTDRTAPNGRFELCLPNDPQVLVEVVPLGDYVAGTIVVIKDVLGANGTFSLRSFTAARGQMPPFGYDAAKAQVYVHVIGAARTVDVSSPHAAGFHFDGTAWLAGQTGTDVYVPNIDPAGGVTKIAVTGATEVGTVPIAAGAFTYVAVAAL
jgi:hypothetical protein